MPTCLFDAVKTESSSRPYGVLPREALNDWALTEINLSKLYHSGSTPGVSASRNEYLISEKKKILDDLTEAVRTRAGADFKADYIREYRDMFVEHLDDPGLLHNFRYFCVPSSDFMMRFYLYNWMGRMAPVMELLHGYGTDLKGNFRWIPETDVWATMNEYEGMCINERRKASSVARVARELYDGLSCPPALTFFGGGNLPERFYDLPNSLITVFDDAKTKSAEELFAGDFENAFIRKNFKKFSENLLYASTHTDLLHSQDLVVMHGVSMYLGKELTKKALLVAFSLLRDGGLMMFDHILLTASLERCLETQGWPKGRGEMDILPSTSDSILRVRSTLEDVNRFLKGQGGGVFDVVEVRPNLIEPWGVQSVCYTLKKTV